MREREKNLKGAKGLAMALTLVALIGLWSCTPKIELYVDRGAVQVGSAELAAVPQVGPTSLPAGLVQLGPTTQPAFGPIAVTIHNHIEKGAVDATGANANTTIDLADTGKIAALTFALGFLLPSARQSIQWCIEKIRARLARAKARAPPAAVQAPNVT